MSENPLANGGPLLEDLTLPKFRDDAVQVPGPCVAIAEATRETEKLLRNATRLNLASKNFHIVKRMEHKRYINQNGEDMPEILHWKRKRRQDMSQLDQPADSKPQTI